MSETEHEIQATVFDWRQRMVNQNPPLAWLYAIPNGGERTGRAGKMMKAEGVRPGVPDICLPVSVSRGWGRWFGLYIEIKTLTGTLSDEQAVWIDGLRALGYRAEVCRGVDETLDTICDYLSIERGY